MPTDTKRQVAEATAAIANDLTRISGSLKVVEYVLRGQSMSKKG